MLDLNLEQGIGLKRRDNKVVNYRVLQDLGRGEKRGVAQKTRLIVSPKDRENLAKLNLFVKWAAIYTEEYLFGDESADMSNAERYYERWKYLNKIGINTLTSLRVLNGDYVGMWDMESDGSRFFGKDEKMRLEREGVFGKYDEHDIQMFKKFISVSGKEVENKILEMMDLAWENNIMLPIDDEEYTVLMHPDGRWEVMTVDLSFLSIKPKSDYSDQYFANKKTEAVERYRKHRELVNEVLRARVASV